jgi:hypothetical protein
MSFLVTFLYCYALDDCQRFNVDESNNIQIFLRRSYLHTYSLSMLVSLDTLEGDALIVVLLMLGDALWFR